MFIVITYAKVQFELRFHWHNCSFHVCFRSSYADIGDSIWPHYGKHLVLSVQVLELLFMATLYPIVAASVMKGLLPRLRISSGLWVLVFGLLMLPNIFFRKLYHISIMSTLTVVSAVCISVVLTLYCFTQAGTWQTYDLNEFDLKEFVASIGVMVASYSSQMYLSIIECDMKKPKDAPLVMNAGYFAMTALKIGVGVIAYMTFGENTHEVVTLNLPTGMILTAVNIVVVILSLSSYTLPMFTVFEILEKDSPWLVTGDIELSSEKELKNLDEETKQSYIAIRRTVVRLALVIVTLIMAVSVPHFGLVLSFIGSFTGAFLEMVFPSLFYVILKHERISTVTIVLNILIVGFSMLFMGVGIYFSGMAMVKAFKLHTREVWTID